MHARYVDFRLAGIELVFDFSIFLRNGVEALHADSSERLTGFRIGHPVAQDGIVASVDNGGEDQQRRNCATCDFTSPNHCIRPGVF